MVTVDDATYVKMKDTLYGGDAGKASRAKAQIEANYDDAKYNDFMTQLNGMQSQATSSNNSGPADGYATATDRNMATGGAEFGRNNQTSTNVVEETTTKQQETPIDTVPEIKQEGELKPLSQDYYNQTSDEALNVIRNNLEDYKQRNPEFFKDYETFKKNFSYNARNEEQRNLLDQWYNGYQEGLSLSGTPTSELYTQYKNGQLSATQLESLRISNPAKYSELQEQINKGNIIAAYDETIGDKSGAMTFQDMAYEMFSNIFKTFMSGGADSGASQYFAELRDKMNSPEMMELSDKTTEIDEQRDLVIDDIESIKKSVEKEYEGKGASRAKINAIISDRTYELQQQLRTLDSEYKKYATQYNNRMQQYQNEFQLQLQEYQVNMQARQQQMSELGFAMDLLSFETPQQQQERQWEFRVRQQEYTNGNINSKDYQTRYKAALTSVQNLLSQYPGIPMTRSAEQMAQDILKAIDNGSDLGTELTKINKLIQGKDEYKYMYNKTFAPETSSGFGKTFTVGNTQYLEYNDKLYTAEEFNKQFGGKYNHTPVSAGAVSDGLEAFKNKVQGLVDTGGAIRKGWCGEPVNDYLKSIGSDVQYDNYKSTKLDSITPGAGPKVGSIAIWDGSTFSSPAAQESGHVAIVTDVDMKNGKITVLESNGQAKKMGMGYGTYDMKNVTGYFDPSAGSIAAVEYNTTDPYSGISGYTTNGTEINAGGWITSLQDQFGRKWASNDERNSTLKSYGLVTANGEADVKLYNEMQQRYKDYLADTKLRDSITELRDTAKELLAWEEKNNSTENKGDLHKGWADRQTVDQGYWKVWFLEGKTDAAEGYALYDYIKRNETLKKFLEMKDSGGSFGAMSDSEWDILGAAANKIDWSKQDKATFQKFLKEMVADYDKVLNKLGGPADITPVEPDMQELEYTPVDGFGSGILTKVIDGQIRYSYDGGRTRN